MRGTISRRITWGFALGLALVVVMATIGVWALSSTTAAYHGAVIRQRDVVQPALRAESQLRSANVDFLRYLIEKDPAFLTARTQIVDSARTLLTTLRDQAETASVRADWVQALGLLDQWDQASRASAAAVTAEGAPEAMRIRSVNVAPTRDRLENVISSAIAQVSRGAVASVDEGEVLANSMRTALIVAAAITLLLGMFGVALLLRAITRPLRESSNVIASSSAQILAAATEQAASANETMAAVTETVATVDEVAQTAEQATQRARAVADSAQRAAEIGRNGRDAVSASVSAMASVRAQVETIAQSIVALAEQGQAIGEIMTAVSDIAEQTHLLALNAAVEAARAGEQGRGFAVVAGEVRALAEQSKDATQQVRRILGEIQRATSTAVMATEQGTKLVASGSDQASAAGNTIRSLADAVSEAAQAAAQIVASAGQQALGMEQIRQAIANIHEATQQNLTASRQTEKAAQDLNQLGGRLVVLVGERGDGAARAG